MGNVYLRSFELPSDAQEIDFIIDQKRTCYNGIYPFKLFPQKELRKLRFGPVTILCGGNGSGKTTILNLIAEKLGLMRHSAFSGGAFFSTFVGMCSESSFEIPPSSQYLSSDDVFDYMLNIRYLNDGIDVRREELFEDYLHRKYASHRLKSLKEYEDWKDSYDAKSKSKSQSQYVRERLADLEGFVNDNNTEFTSEKCISMIKEVVWSGTRRQATISSLQKELFEQDEAKAEMSKYKK